jgi:hypothetical protein
MELIRAQALNPIALQLNSQGKLGFVAASKPKPLPFVMEVMRRFVHEKTIPLSQPLPNGL